MPSSVITSAQHPETASGNPAVPPGPRKAVGDPVIPGDLYEDAYGVVGSGPSSGRRAGVVLHPTSLPGPHGSGDLGAEARNFIDWMERTGLQVWQVLPLVPPDEEYFSPYSGVDTNCGSPLLISLDVLIEQQLLDPEDAPPHIPVDAAQFQAVADMKGPLLQKAAQQLLDNPFCQHLRDGMAAFRAANVWVEEAALFDALKKEDGRREQAWWQWEDMDLRAHKEEALAPKCEEHARLIDEFVAVQYLFDSQWQAIRQYANARGVKIVGDMPIYVGGHSADVWAHQSLFELGESGEPAYVSGVPPDAFSATGQLWGSPLYAWSAHEEEGYAWWAQRLGRAFELYDETRIDHFRAFAGYWCVEASQNTAMIGCWRAGPGMGMFTALREKLGSLPIMAEDLGVITPDVVRLREETGAPGMVVLQFAWGSDSRNTHLPHNHYANSFCYPGTHDNDTSVGWWQDCAQDREKEYIRAYTGMQGDDIAYAFIKESLKSVSATAVFTMQDIMRLDNSARMNTPGVAAGNWSWRMGEGDVWDRLGGESEQLRALLAKFDRLPPRPKEADDDSPQDA